MRAGVSQIDITPDVGGELAGFGNRVQPSAGVLDPLFAKCLYLEDAGERLLWVHADLVGIDRAFVLEFRRWAKQLGLEPSQVLMSATHTHSGPVTVRFPGWWKFDEAYMRTLRGWLEQASADAVAGAEECEVVSAEGHLDLGIDRRNKPTAHTDPLVGALGWRRADGTFPAVVVNYTMHAVALGGQNRSISADVPGQAAVALSRDLPGGPVVLVTNGACGNIDPPGVGVEFDQVRAWGEQLASAIVGPLAGATPMPAPSLRLASRTVPLPLEVLDREEIDRRAEEWTEKWLAGGQAEGQYARSYRHAIELWQRTMAENVGKPEAEFAEAELFALAVGDVMMVGVNAEIFSRFTEQVRKLSGRGVFTVGYANGVIGYIPTSEAYAEGGYEVDSAMFVYNISRPRKGGLELLAERAAGIVSEIADD